MSHDYVRFFPFSKVREVQDKAISFVLDSFLDSGKRFVILEAPVGVGKSAIGMTISRFLQDKMEGGQSGTYYLTTQKVLQDQLDRDFGPNALGLIRSIKASSNYTCSYHPDRSCAESKRILAHIKELPESKDFNKVCTSNCPYSKAKNQFIQSSLGVTNFSYFLAETTYAKKLEPRHLLVIDEAHNTETELSKFIEVIFSAKFSKDILKVKLPVSESQDAIVLWIKTHYLPSLKKHIKKSENEIRKLVSSGGDTVEESKRYEMLDKHICKVNRFLSSYDPKNWIMNVVLPPPGTKAGKKYEFKPIDVSMYAEEVLFRFGERVLLMSATILNKTAFCRSLGIPENDVEFMSLPSPFPPENRPIHVLSVGSMSKRNIDQTLPNMVHVIKEILAQHKDQKGIIHATNYKVAKFLQDNIGDDRILIHDSTNRDKVLKRHLETSEPTVLLSPSMMEGVDLADESSRFQVICKVPFPYLGDTMVKRRMETDDMWYPYQTAKLIIQSLGRSIRNEKDHAVSYILDSDWEQFYSRNRNMFPPDFSTLLG